jgi:hypothetical protein
MKIENQQSNITNPQFSGGRQIGATVGTQSSTYANAALEFAGIANTTGSFRLVDTFGVNNVFSLTASSQTVANLNATESVKGNTFYISISGSDSAANKVTAIASFLNVSASAIVQATGSTTTLQLTSSLNGDAGNFVSVVSGSTISNLSGGTGNTTYSYSFPFIAGGLYVGGAGTVVATTLDGSRLTFASASAGSVIPGLFLSVSGSSTATGLIALD